VPNAQGHRPSQQNQVQAGGAAHMADEADGAVPATLCRRSGKHSTPAFRLVFKPGQLVRGYAAAQTCSNMRGTCQAVAVVDVHVPGQPGLDYRIRSSSNSITSAAISCDLQEAPFCCTAWLITGQVCEAGPKVQASWPGPRYPVCVPCSWLPTVRHRAPTQGHISGVTDAC
jgi:hypothetical protein